MDVTINPIGLLFGDFSVGGDFGLSEKMSVELQAGYGGKSFKTAGYKWSNVPINAVGKFYFNPNHGADRFYADVFARFINRSYKYDDATLGISNYKSTRVGVGFGLGYKVVSGGGFVFDINFGAGRAFVDKQKFEDSNGTQTTVDWPKIMFQGKLGIGYRFGGDGGSSKSKSKSKSKSRK